MTEEEEKRVEDFVSLCQRVLDNINKKIRALTELSGHNCYSLYPHSHRYEEEIDTSFLNSLWCVYLSRSGINEYERLSLYYDCQKGSKSKVWFHIDVLRESSNDLNREIILKIQESNESPEELICQLTQATRRAITRFDEDFKEEVKKQSFKIAQEVAKEKLSTLLHDV